MSRVGRCDKRMSTHKKHQGLATRVGPAIYVTIGLTRGAQATMLILQQADLVLAGRGHVEGRLARRIRLVAHFLQLPQSGRLFHD